MKVGRLVGGKEGAFSSRFPGLEEYFDNSRSEVYNCGGFQDLKSYFFGQVAELSHWKSRYAESCETSIGS